jgi:hypothetical protein
MNWFMIINWSVMVLGGIYCYLVIYDVIDPFKGDEERKALWHKKSDKWLKICAPVMIVCGILLILFEFL